ncbi:uncharacterized protein TNCV_4210191 [Trichonephila clavipes]|nr:uncharacterized protein TNCV_4210191 [Trichonephila clavipes]
MITNFFIPELNNHDLQELWFQQNGATCHTARATIDLLKDTFGDRLISRFGPVDWPPRSCDLTPLEYFLWGYVKSLVYADKPQTLDHLEDNIRRVIADIRPQMLEKVIESWTSRLDYIRASRGSHMPEIIFKMIIKQQSIKAIAILNEEQETRITLEMEPTLLTSPTRKQLDYELVRFNIWIFFMDGGSSEAPGLAPVTKTTRTHSELATPVPGRQTQFPSSGLQGAAEKNSNKGCLPELWFQQDGATCHTARATINLLKDTFGDRLISRFGPVNWPPRSCDLTPLDYFLWGYVKSLVYADKPQTLDFLEDNIRRVIAGIRPQMLENVIENWTTSEPAMAVLCQKSYLECNATRLSFE